MLSQEAFDTFLAWLDADRDRAGEKYEEIRRKLIRDFVHRDCLDAEELADETINRVIRELPEIANTYAGDPASYVYAVAQSLPLRYWRKESDARKCPLVNEPKMPKRRQRRHERAGAIGAQAAS